MKIRPVGTEGRTDRETYGQTEGQTDMKKLIVAFRNFCESALKPAVTVHDVFLSSLILSSYLIFSIATNYGLDGPEIEFRSGEIFRPFRPALWPTQSSVQWVPDLFWGLSTAGACC